MTVSDDLFQMIEKRRAELTKQLDSLIEARDHANDGIKTVRAQLDDLPVRKVRRARKGPVGVDGLRGPAEEQGE
jgi:uncharacterized coiled-coil DUF342 family protein